MIPYSRQKITNNDVFIKRPAISISARYLPSIVGMTASSDIDENAALKWNDLI